MDKSQPSHGRDGHVSHSTYGSRDKGGSQGQDRTARMTTADRMMRDAEKKFLKHMSNAEKVDKGYRNPNIDEGSETAADIDKKIEFHKQGQAAAQYKGSMNKMHAAKIRELETKKAALKKQGVAEADASFRPSTSNSGVNPELRGVSIPGNMKHPEWREPTWSFTEIAEKLGVSPKELQVLVLAIGNFPKKLEGLKSSHGSRAYYPRSEIKRWVQSSNIREIIKSRKGVAETQQMCPECGGPAFSDLVLAEKQDACYHKVKSRYKVWPSAYASGALVQCRKKGAANWGNKSKK